MDDVERRPKGIIITNLFPNRAEPTRGTFVWQETQALRAFMDLKVVSPLPYVPPWLRGRSKYAFHAAPRRDELDGLEVHYPRHLVFPNMLRPLYGPLMEAALYPLLRRLTAEQGSDILIAHYAYPDGYAAVRVGRALGLPVLVKVRGSDVNIYLRSTFRRAQTRWALQRAAHVITVSRALRERVIELGIPPERVSATPNGVDASRFNPLDRARCREELGLEPEPFLFLFVGMLRPIKNVLMLLKAFRDLPESRRRHARLVLLGEGELEAEVQRRIVDYQMEREVRRLPFVSHDQVPRWLGASDCLVLPSVMEGYPNVLVEALASGRPVIASRVGGIPEIVAEGKTGLLVDPARTASITDAMATMMDGFAFDAAAAGAAARGWKDVAAEMAALARGVLAARDAVSARGRAVRA